MNRPGGWVKVHKSDGDAYDDRVLAKWVRLLMLADSTWPSPAPIPAWFTKPLRAALAGRVVVSGDTYRIPEYDEGREGRSGKARAAAEASWEARKASPSDAPSSAPSDAPSPSRGNALTQTQTKTHTQMQTGSYPPSDVARGAGSPANDRVADAAWGRLTHPGWSLIRDPLAERGIRYPPSGDPDEPDTQANVWWQMVDAGPERVVQWMRDAPPSNGPASLRMYDLTGHLTARWREVRDAVEPDPPLPRRSRTDSDGMTHIGDVL